MRKTAQIEYLNLEKNREYEKVIEKVINKCFIEEKLDKTKLYISITLTTPENIRKINKEYRNVDKPTDVLSFPMFEKEEIEAIIRNEGYDVEDIIGDIIICVDKVAEQAKEYNHSFERELSYMVVHGFYHIMGYDHIKEEDKIKMRPKEEKILQELKITRM